VCIGTGLFLQSKIQARFAFSPYYKQSFVILRQNRAAVDMLGEPIKEGSVDLRDNYNFTNETIARLKVPVKGKHNRGQLFLWASRPAQCEPWDVDRLELGLKTEPDRHLLLFARIPSQTGEELDKNVTLCMQR